MATIYVDGKKYKVKESKNVLEVCLSLDLDLPYFCWHPALGSIGVCRQCMVKQYKNIHDIHGRLVIACMTPVTDNMFISIKDNEAQKFRKSVIEWMMINHPHDCPVCEEGGHCHLQDMTVMTGQHCRRYRFTKHTHRNQYLGPFISHEMNRCITCYRCIRYYKDYAGGNDFGVYGIHDNIYFGRTKDGMLESEFSGNLIEICPTGVFTDKTYSQHYSRKWDMQFSPSICHQCCIGCNISPGERYGELRRIENRYNGSVNHYFLCDLGRFGYGYVNLKNRPRQPLQRYDNKWIVLDSRTAIQNIAKRLLETRNKIIGIGSSRASIENNFALRELVGVDNFYSGMNMSENKRLALILHILKNSGIYTPSLREIENYDAVLILGEDITQTGARIALAVRQAITNKRRKIASIKKIFEWQIEAIMNIGQKVQHPLFITNVDRTRLDDIAAWSYYAPVDDQARLGFAIAHAIDEKAPVVTDIDISIKSKINIIAQALSCADKPLIISGSNSGSEAIITAAANIACALKKRGHDVGMSFVTANDANSMGLAMIGGQSLDHAIDILENGEADSVIILENNIYRHASSVRIDTALSKVKNIIVLDHQSTLLQKKADFVLPAASFAESAGTLINQEGRAQRFFQVYNPVYYDNKVAIMDSWRWLHFLHSTYTDRQIKWKKLDDVIDEIVKTLPQLAGIKHAAPNADFRIHGQKLVRKPNRYSGHTAMCANINIHETRVPQDKDTMFAFSMEGNNAPKAPRQHIAFAWYPGWNSPQAWNKFQNEIGSHLYYGDPGIRLLEPEENKLNYFSNIPPAFQSMQDLSWCIAPYWHLFGSEETSQLSFIIKKHMPAPYVMVSYEDASRLNISSNKNTFLTFSCVGMEFCLPILFSNTLHSGQLGLPLGLPGIPTMLSGHKINHVRKTVL